MVAVLSSVTSQSRMKRYVEFHGQKVRTMQTPKAIAKGGCGYSLVVPDDAMEEVQASARKMQAQIRGFYREEGAGKEKRYIPIKPTDLTETK